MKKKKQATFPKCYFKIFALLKRGKQMDRHDIGASGWKPDLLPESASSNHWHPRRDADIEEMQGNGWGPGAGRKAFGRH